MSKRKIFLAVLGAGAFVAIGLFWYVYSYAEFDIYKPLFANQCASCHGADLKGIDSTGPALVGGDLLYGDSVADLMASISNTHLSLDGPQYSERLTQVEIKGLSIYIAEKRLGQSFKDFRYERQVNLPSHVLQSTHHHFSVDSIADGLHPMVFSIEPLPNGSFLLTEKERGLSIISAQGEQSDLIQGLPSTGGSIDVLGIQYGSGWLLDVALDPDYERNGWIYLHHTHIWQDSCSYSIGCRSMNRLIRGRIEEGRWIDQEVLWEAPEAFYNRTPDTGAGGRIAFDTSGHVYFSLGIKDSDLPNDTNAQDLSNPYGKIHRVNLDGSIPLDNPFADPLNQNTQDLRASIWTFGHRSPQGLEWNPQRQRIWNSEMGPRGGDELNELVAGGNYGWPFHSNGLEYAGAEVARHKPKAIEFDPSEIEHTLVDITPSPAISSFVVYQGKQFSNWQQDVLIGSLKGSSLFRMRFNGTELVERETLIKDLARIRDVEVGYDGLIYLLLETKTGSSIVRLTPET